MFPTFPWRIGTVYGSSRIPRFGAGAAAIFSRLPNPAVLSCTIWTARPADLCTSTRCASCSRYLKKRHGWGSMRNSSPLQKDHPSSGRSAKRSGWRPGMWIGGKHEHAIENYRRPVCFWPSCPRFMVACTRGRTIPATSIARFGTSPAWSPARNAWSYRNAA